MGNGIVPVNEKPIAASAALADFFVMVLNGKVQRASIETIADCFSQAQIEALKKAAEDITTSMTEDAKNAADRAESAASRLEGFLSAIATDVNYDPSTFLLTLINEAGAQIGDGTTIKAGLSDIQMDVETDADGNKWLVLKNGDGDEMSRVQMPSGGGSGGGTGSTIKIVNELDARLFSVVEGRRAQIKYSWISTDDSDGSNLGAGSATWVINGTKAATQVVQQGSNTFDVTNYLAPASTNTVKLTIEDAYGTTKTFTWQITVVSYSLTWNLDEMSIYEDADVALRLVPSGDGAKRVYVTCDSTQIYNEEITTTGRAINVTVPAQAHGAHTVKAWMEATVDGELITSDVLVHEGLWLADGDTTPVIGVASKKLTLTQYATAGIRYMVVTPGSLTSTIHLVNGTAQSALTVDRSIQTWAFRTSSAGTFTLSITCGDVSVDIEVTVESIGYDIKPVTNGLVFDIDPSGHSNAEDDKESFGYKDAAGTNHPLTFSPNFDWDRGGFQLDEDGVTALVIKRGTYVTCDRSLFGDDAAANGKEIKAVFKCKSVRDYDAEILNCVSGNIGLKLQAQQATLSSELESVTVPYCEDRKIEMDVNIEATNENMLATVWLLGVPSRVLDYKSNDNWMQAVPAQLKIGSDECDVWLYRMKMYGNSLTRYEILDNFIADCADAEEMVSRYERNDIFATDGSIDVNKLAAANPKLRIVRISADRMTTGKSDPVTCTVDFIYTDGGNAYSFHATDVIMKVQGTSSAAYGEAAFNVDLDFSQAGFVLGSGETVAKYAMDENAIPESYFNIKLNVASSENANNVILADEYNTYQPWLSAARREDSRVRDTVQGKSCVVFFTNTSTAPVKLGARTAQPNQTIMYGCGDFNNSKKNFDVFGQDNERWPKQCCVEISNNIADQCLFKSDDLSTETWDGNGAFEFRYPKKPTDEMKAAFQTMLSWVVSTDTTAPTGNTLSAPVTFNGTTYTNDTKAYRAAKFKAEVSNYFTVDSLLYHYLFTERHTMIDNRAKNVFISYEYDPDVQDYRWNVCKDYDNDTADGNDNEGGLTFSYGLEDTDNIGTKPVFNASSSVLWCNVRDYLSAELEAMFKDREAAGAWDAKRILQKYKDYQAARPEALIMEDMWGKYFAPYINNGNTAYLDMMQGSKEDQRAQFETYQEGYMSAKYGGAVATADVITFRANTPAEWGGVEPSGDIVVTLYARGYVFAKIGSYVVRFRAERGTPYTVKCPISAALSDTEYYVYLASNISAVGSVAGLYCQYVDIGYARRLTSLSIGSGAAGYTNKNMAEIGIGNNTLIEYLDLRGTPNLKKSLNLAAFESLKTLLLTGSGVSGVEFADGGPLETAALSAVASLTAKRLEHIDTFTMDGSALRTIWVEDCPGIDTLFAVNAATGLSRGRLIGVDWSIDTADVLLKLAMLSGMDENGTSVGKFVLTGKCHIATVAQSELDTIMAAFPNLQLTYGELVGSFTVKFLDTDGTVLNTQIVRQYGAAVNPITAGLIPTPTKAATVDKVYSFIGWNRVFNYILADTTVTAVYSETPREYTVRWWVGTVLKQTDVVEAYGRCSYNGDDPTASDGIWMGWDKLTDSVTSDLDVHAVFVSPTLPDTVATEYDYLYSDDSNDNSAYTLSEFYGIIASGLSRQYFKKNDKIKIVPNTDVFQDTAIVLQLESFKHYRLWANRDEWAGPFFGMVGVMNTPHRMHSTNDNSCSFKDSEMLDYLTTTIFPALPQQWKAMIKPIEVLASAGNTSANIVACEAKLTLRSQASVGFNVNDVPYKNEVAEGADEVTFDCYTDNASRIKKAYNGEGGASSWWLLSPAAASSSAFCFVISGGNSPTGGASYSWGVSFGFCL